MRLSTKQILFCNMMDGIWLPKARKWAEVHDYDLMLVEAWRSEASARANAKKGSGIVNSNHRKKLARDYLLWKHGKPIWASEVYTPLGEYWEDMSRTVNGVGIVCCWGGRFRGRTGPDGGHFSFLHNGVK